MENKKIARAFSISILSMLLPMVLATRVLSTALLPVLYAMGFCVQFLAMMWCLTVDRHIIKIRKNPVRVLILYMIVLMLPFLNTLISGRSMNIFDPINSIIKVISFFLYYVMIQSVRIEEDEIYKFCKTIVVISVLVCIYSLIFEFRDILSISTVLNTNTLKIRSVFANRNQYSAFLVVAFVANLYLNEIKRERWRNVTFLLQFFCILTTFSRAALFSVIIIIFMLFLQKKNLKKKIIVLMMSAILLTALLFTTGIFEYFLKNYIRLGQGGTGVDSGRFSLWKIAWGIAKENHFLGVGFYTAADILMSKVVSLSQFHSMFFDLLAGGGIPELLFVIMVLYTTYRRCVKRCPNRQLVYVYKASLVAFVFHACVESLSIFALSYSDVLYAIFYISMPILFANISDPNEINQDSITQSGDLERRR